MIISIEKKFIFVANLKTASTSIESALRPHGDIVVRRSELGKHLAFSEIQKRFSWLFEVLDEQVFFKFGVIRDPVDYTISLYRSHMDEKFRDSPGLYTGNMSFEEFLEQWVPKNRGQMQPQINKFKDQNGEYALNRLIFFEDLKKSFPQVMKEVGIPEIELPNLNVSPGSKVEVDDFSVSIIKNIFSEDYEAINMFC